MRHFYGVLAMSEVIHPIKEMSLSAVDAVRTLEQEALKLPQVPIETHHTFHAGAYARTVKIPAGVVMTGVLMRIPTILILAGDCLLYGADGPIHYSNYNVLTGNAGRKQACAAITDTHATMIFATSAIRFSRTSGCSAFTRT